MIKRQEIKRAIILFRHWDNNNLWEKPTSLFVSHTLRKAEDSLNTSRALLKLMSDKRLSEMILPDTDYNACLWIINAAYYSMFFLTQVLLGRDGKKLPENTDDTHKTVFLALLNYYIIKGSGLEGKKEIDWEDIQKSRMSDALIIFKESMSDAESLLQLRKAKEAVESFKLELDKRTELTYSSTRDAELSFARASIGRVQRFWEILNEYMAARRV